MIDTSFLLQSTGGKLLQGKENTSFSSVSIDSRKTSHKQLFFALKGSNFDGHDFINEAIEKGATGVVVEKPLITKLDKNITVIETTSTLEALRRLANAWRKRFKNLKVICITGSNGKTSTKEMTSSILSTRYNVLKTQGNLNNHIGLPLTLLGLKEEHDCCVCEIGMNNFGEIRTLTKTAEPDIGAITNIGSAHLEQLGTIEGVAQAKGELVEDFDSRHTFVVNLDDPYVKQIAQRTHCKKITYSLSEKEGDVRALNIRQEKLNRISFDLHIENSKTNIELEGIGSHNVANALCASAISLAMGMSLEEIKNGLKNYTPVHMRLEVMTSPQGFKILNDAYNANPNSTMLALKELSSLKNNNKTFAVLGDMLELGKHSIKEHKKIGELINELNIDFVICLGKYSRYIKDAIEDPNKVEHVDDHQKATNLIKKLANKEDLILVKGSRGMRMEKIIQNLFG